MLSKEALLEDIFSDLTMVFKYANISESEIHDVVESAFAKVQLPPDAMPGAPSLPLDHAFFLENVVTVWRTDVRFLDALGDPIPLALVGPHPSIQSLMNVTQEKDVPIPESFDPRIVAERLVAHGAAELDADDYRLIMSAFRVRSHDTPAHLSQLDYIRGFCQTIAHNAYKGQGGRLQRIARTQRFPADKVPVVNQILEDQGMRFLETVDEVISGYKVSLNDNDRKTVFLGVGIYLIEDPEN